MNKIIESLPEMVEEEKKEDEKVNSIIQFNILLRSLSYKDHQGFQL